jgi:hypothetical protein
MTDHTTQPLTEAELAAAREFVDGDLPTAPGSYQTAVELLEDMVAEVDRLRAENTALAGKVAAVHDVITPKNPDWVPLTERYPEYFTPDTPEEAARKKGWKQGVDLQTQRIRAAIDADAREQWMSTAPPPAVAEDLPTVDELHMESAEAAVDAWNATHPVGTIVRYWKGLREGEGRLGRTRSEATLLGGHTPVVWVDTTSGAIGLTHVEPVAEEPAAALGGDQDGGEGRG